MRILLIAAALVFSVGVSTLDAAAAGGGKVVHISSAKEFDDIIAQAKGKKEIIVADFYADWCGPCKMLAPVLEELANENVGKLIVLKINTDNVKDLAQRFKISGIPALHKFQDGKEVAHTEGFQPKAQIKTWIGL